MPAAPSARSHGFASAIAICFILASYLTPSWSQTDGSSATSSLPALPNATSSNPLPATFSNPVNGTPVYGTHAAGSMAQGVAVIGQSHVAATHTHLMSSATLSNGAQQVVLVDPARLTLVVYHIDPSKGDVQLKSVRRIDADFSLEEFNLGEPTPSTIRKNLRIGNDR